MIKLNKRLKRLKHKHYLRLRADIWGTVGLKNKKNKLTKDLKISLEQDFKFKIKNFSKKNKTAAYRKIEKKTFFSRTKLKKKRRFFEKKEFDFNIVVKPREKKRKRVSYRGMLLNQRRRFLIFFGEKFLRKHLRKLMKFYKIGRSRFLEKRFEVSFPSQKSFGSVFGSRVDLTLFRSNFCKTMRESRQLVKHNKVMVMSFASRKNFFVFKRVKNLAYQIPLFTPMKLEPVRQKKRKNEFRHFLLKNSVYYARPKDLWIDYKSFISFRISDTNKHKVPFGGNLSYFAGLSKYF